MQQGRIWASPEKGINQSADGFVQDPKEGVVWQGLRRGQFFAKMGAYARYYFIGSFAFLLLPVISCAGKIVVTAGGYLISGPLKAKAPPNGWAPGKMLMLSSKFGLTSGKIH